MESPGCDERYDHGCDSEDGDPDPQQPPFFAIQRLQVVRSKRPYVAVHVCCPCSDQDPRQMCSQIPSLARGFDCEGCKGDTRTISLRDGQRCPTGYQKGRRTYTATIPNEVDDTSPLPRLAGKRSSGSESASSATHDTSRATSNRKIDASSSKEGYNVPSRLESWGVLNETALAASLDARLPGRRAPATTCRIPTQPEAKVAYKGIDIVSNPAPSDLPIMTRQNRRLW